MFIDFHRLSCILYCFQLICIFFHRFNVKSMDSIDLMDFRRFPRILWISGVLAGRGRRIPGFRQFWRTGAGPGVSLCACWRCLWASMKRLSGVSFSNIFGILRVHFGVDYSCPAGLKKYCFVYTKRSILKLAATRLLSKSDPLREANKSSNVSSQ